LDINGYVLKYYSSTNIATTLFRAPISQDIAHNATKLWVNSPSTLYEYDITLQPWSQVANRNITTSPIVMGFGLCAVPGTNTKIITTDTSRSPQVLVELDITTTTATYRDIAILPVGAVTPGDIIITDTPSKKILIILNSVTSGANGLYQYDYLTGAFETYVPLGLAAAAFGLYEESGLIYLINGGGSIYSLLPTSPYTVTFVQTAPTSSTTIVGASQLPNCTTVTLTPSITTTTTTTSPP